MELCYSIVELQNSIMESPRLEFIPPSLLLDISKTQKQIVCFVRVVEVNLVEKEVILKTTVIVPRALRNLSVPPTMGKVCFCVHPNVSALPMTMSL